MAGENQRTQPGREPTFFGSEAHHSATAPYLHENKEHFKNIYSSFLSIFSACVIFRANAYKMPEFA
jgi:hypothetical protein